MVEINTTIINSSSLSARELFSRRRYFLWRRSINNRRRRSVCARGTPKCRDRFFFSPHPCAGRHGYVRGPKRAAVEAGADQQTTDPKQSDEMWRRR